MRLAHALRAFFDGWIAGGPKPAQKAQGDWIDTVFRTAADTLPLPARMTEPFRQHPTAYRAMVAFSRNIARLPFELFAHGTDTALEDHPFARLLRRPNSRMRGTQIFEYTTLHLEHFGDSLWRLGEPVRVDMRGAVAPSEILLLPPRSVRPRLVGGEILSYELVTMGKVEIIPPDQIVHFRYASPYSDVDGQSWIEPAQAEYETDWYAQRWNRDFFRNGAVPSGVLQLKSEGEFAILDEDVERLRTQWEEKHGANLSRGHRTAVMPMGLEFKEIGIGQREMEFDRLRKTSRENVLVAAGLPPALASVLEYANYANMQPQLRIFYELELMPRLAYIESVIQADLLDRFWPGVDGRFKTEVIQALLEDMSIKATVAEKLRGIGVPLSLINDRLELGFDLEGVEGAEDPLVSIQLTPVGALPQVAAPPAVPPAAAPRSPIPSGVEPISESAEVRSVGLVGEQVRSAAWRRLMSVIRELESKAESRWRDHLHHLRADVTRRLLEQAAKAARGPAPRKLADESDIEHVLFNLRQADEEAILLLEPIYHAALKRAADDVAEQTGLHISLDFLDPAVVQILANRRQRIRGTDARMRSELRETIAEGIRAGEPEVDIAQRVRDYFDGERRNARTVARTEVHSSFSSGRFEAMRQAGVERHEWLSARDDRVREDHVLEDGNIVMVGDRFPVTGLLYPLEPGGDPSEVINCRCVPVPIVE